MSDTNSQNSNNVEPKEELKRFIKKFQDMKDSKKESHPYNTLVSLRTYLDTLDIDIVTKDQLIQNMEYLRVQTRNTAMWRGGYKDISETVLRVIDEAYDGLISLLEEIVQRSIPIKAKPPKMPVIKNSKSADFLRRILVKNHKPLQNEKHFDKLSEKNMDELPMEIPKDNFKGIMKIFISHKFVKDNQELALKLRLILRQNNIEGYLAESKREYELLIGDKIRQAIEDSDYVVGIITKESEKSASVNQELGYALGKDIPIVIMIEQNLTHGVLTHGRETEEFTRSDFEKYCKNVVEYVLEKGNKKKISNEEKIQLKENVYEPAYDQLKKSFDNPEFITYAPQNPWDGFTPSWRLKTEPEMVQLFGAFSKELKKYQEMWIDFSTKFIEKKDILGNMLTPVFIKYGFLDQNGNLNAGGSSNPPREWLHNCQDVIFNDNIKNGDELYQILKKDAARHYGDKYSLHFDEWKNKHPTIFTDLLKVIPKLVEELGTKYTHTELDTQRKVLKDNIEKLTLALEEKLKRN